MKIPFTLDTWLKDKSQKVETRDGRLVHNIWRIKEPSYKNNRKAEVCALIDGEEDALVFFEGGRYLPSTKDTDSPFDLFLVTPEEELTDWEKAVGIVLTDYQLLPRDKDGIANIHDINEFTKKKPQNFFPSLVNSSSKTAMSLRRKPFTMRWKRLTRE